MNMKSQMVSIVNMDFNLVVICYIGRIVSFLICGFVFRVFGACAFVCACVCVFVFVCVCVIWSRSLLHK